MSQLLWTGKRRPVRPRTRAKSRRPRRPSPAGSYFQARQRTVDHREERYRTTARLLHLYAAALIVGWAVLLITVCELGRRVH